MPPPLAREPTPDMLCGDTLACVIRRYLGSTRPMFLPASALPVLVGSAWGWQAAEFFDPLVFAVAIMVVLLVHAGANVANDVADNRSGTDQLNEQRIHPFTGGSRFIQNGVMTPRQMTFWAATLLTVGIALGLVLVVLKGPWVLVFGIIGVGLGLAYSLPPLALSSRGMGEVAVAAGFGTLPVFGSFWLQAGLITAEAVLISLPISLWVMAVLVINEIPDVAADAPVGKHTLVVRLGCRASGWLYLALQLAAFLTLVLVALANVISWAGLTLPSGLLVLAAWTAYTANRSRHSLRRGIMWSLTIHALGALWLTALAFAAR